MTQGATTRAIFECGDVERLPIPHHNITVVVHKSIIVLRIIAGSYILSHMRRRQGELKRIGELICASRPIRMGIIKPQYRQSDKTYPP